MVAAITLLNGNEMCVFWSVCVCECGALLCIGVVSSVMPLLCFAADCVPSCIVVELFVFGECLIGMAMFWTV